MIWVNVWKGEIRMIEKMIKVWISVKSLHHWRSNGSQLQWAVWQVIILALNAKIRLLQRRMSTMTEVWNHLHFQVCEIWCESYAFLAVNIFIYDINYDYFWRELLSLMSNMIIFEVDYDDICRYFCLCGVYILSLNSSGTDIPNIKNSPKSKNSEEA